ncbi:hypothetical protein [Pseudomonas aphyarum]|uniref:Uncharacterized protein n=1 Tax=Pseudomonas aphyarum TaxID=2942629 RepID=A0ABT5PKL4_9PSED|nr:hypothetical protein [Pseudomonas aphyarum]MDD0968528.1 hypothetical protein [Pseudomonas aphyarum]MDD1124428.1 hypothetical protein [Pseudomonas aphyarum]
MKVGDFVELEGWLVIIDFRLFLVPENYSENYEQGEKVEISKPEIMFSITDSVLPLGGGRSFIFHRSKISGVLESVLPTVVAVTSLFVEERGGGFLCVDLEDKNIEKCKTRYDEFLEKNQAVNSDDWLDCE